MHFNQDMEAEKNSWFKKKKKRSKPKSDRIVSLDDPVENEDTAAEPIREDQSIIPSAPLLPHDEIVPSSTAERHDSSSRDVDANILRNLYFWVTGHLTVLATFTALLVYIPHLRRILRKNIFDQVLLTSIIGGPLLLAMVVFAYFPSMRKRFAIMALAIISLTMAWLLSYVITVDDAKAMMVSVGSSDVCSLTTIGLSFLPKINMTSRPALMYSPLFMITSNGIYHILAKSSFLSVLPSMAFTLLMTHFAFNARDIVKNRSIDSSDPRFYGLVQMYMKLSAWKSMKSMFNQRSSYQEIE